MPVVSALRSLSTQLASVGLKQLFDIPVKGVEDWLHHRFTDHAAALPNAIATAHDRAWQAVQLALAGDTFLSKVKGLTRDADLTNFRDQIRAFVNDVETNLASAAPGLRAKACDELSRLLREGRLGGTVTLTVQDFSRYNSTTSLRAAAQEAIEQIADALRGEAPHLARVLTLTPSDGSPLLVAAFAYFLRRQIASNAELAREMTHDHLQLLTQTQQAGFQRIEATLITHGSELSAQLGSWFASADAEFADIKTKLDQLLKQNQVSKKPESPLRISVTSENERARLQKLRDRLREMPSELADAEVHSLLGDGLAAAGQFPEAEQAHRSAGVAAHEVADRTAEAEAAYKQFKDACEQKHWGPALTALNHAIALDSKRYRPVPKHYRIERILGAGSFGVVFLCRNTIAFDEEGNELGVAVKTFREVDLERPVKDIFLEATTLKNLTHVNIIRVFDHGYANSEASERPFIAMEFFDGITLEERLAQHGKLSLQDGQTIFYAVASALHAAHTGKRAIIHRDLKPANIMVRCENGIWTVKVIDFGLAVRSAVRNTSMSVPHSLRCTRDQSVTGTIKYAAPEQLGEKTYPIGPHSDVYAFGKTVLEALLGTVQPTPRHWKQLPDAIADMLARCVDEEYLPSRADEARFHTFGPVLETLAPKPDPEIQRQAEAKRREQERAQAEEAERRAEIERQAEAKRREQERLDRQRQAEDAERERTATAAKNLQRLLTEKSAQLQSWVEQHLNGWDHTAWTKLTTTYRPEYAPFDEAGLGLNLESERADLQAKAEQRAKAEEAKRQAEAEAKRRVEAEQRAKAEAVRPKHKIGDIYTNELGMKFAWVPPGNSWLGGGDGKEGTTPFTLPKGMWCGVYPVSQAEWKAVMGDEPSWFRKGGGGEKQITSGGWFSTKTYLDTSRFPVEYVSWDRVQEFITALNKKHVNSEHMYRLPTEQEWEYICRGGPLSSKAQSAFHYYFATSKTDLRPAPANDLSSKQAHFGQGDRKGRPCDVGLYLPNPLGIYDLHGNIWEWTDTLYENRSLRVIRGGSWHDSAGNCRAAYRYAYTPSNTNSDVGVRLARVPRPVPGSGK